MLIPEGNLYLSSVISIDKLPEYVTTRLLITRRKGRVITGVTWYPLLAPSEQLFTRYIKEWKYKNVPNWWDLYKESFIKEMVEEPMLSSMGLMLKKIKQGEDIAFICFCTNKKKQCHRYLLSEVFKACGIKIIDVTFD